MTKSTEFELFRPKNCEKEQREATECKFDLPKFSAERERKERNGQKNCVAVVEGLR